MGKLKTDTFNIVIGVTSNGVHGSAVRNTLFIFLLETYP